VTFELLLARPVDVRIGLYDVAGRRVREILSGPVEAGTRVVTWDGRNDVGNAVPPGLYWMRAVAQTGAGADRIETKSRQILRLTE
jgi:flagellar basal-body rod modification protein FlgD